MSVIGANTKLNMGSVWCCLTYMHTMEYDSGIWRSGKSNFTATASESVLVK